MRKTFATVLLAASALALCPLHLASAITIVEGDDGFAQVYNILGSGITVDSYSYTGANAAVGTFDVGLGIAGVILSTGSVINADNTSMGGVTTLGQPGDADLDPFGNFETEDAAFIEYVFSTDNGNAFLNFGFLTDESTTGKIPFTDVFAVFIDGQNYTLFPSGVGVSVNSISTEGLFQDVNGAFGVSYQSGAGLFQMQAFGLAAGFHTLKIAIADVGDSVVDSAVLIQGGSFSSTAQPIDDDLALFVDIIPVTGESSDPNPTVFAVAYTPSEVILVDLGAISSVYTSGLPVALAQRSIVQSTTRSAIRDLDGRLYRLRSRELLGDNFTYKREQTDAVVIAPDGKAMVVDMKEAKSMASKKEVVAPDWTESARFEFFASGDFGYTDGEETESLIGFETDTIAGSIGLEYRVNENLTLGAAGSYIHSESDVLGDLADVELEGFAISGYASYYANGFYGDLLYSFSTYEHDLDRKTGLGRTARAEPESNNHLVEFNTGYNIQAGSFVTGPLLGIEYLNGNLDDYRETGGANANLHIDEQDYESLITRLGWQASYRAELGSVALIPQVRAAWERENLDDPDTVTGSLVTSPTTIISRSGVRKGEKFKAAGTSDTPGRDYLTLGAGLRFEFGTKASVLLDYEGQFLREDREAHFGAIKVSLPF